MFIDERIRELPIGENLAVLEETCQGAGLDPSDVIGDGEHSINEMLDAGAYGSDVVADCYFGYGYLRGLGDACGMTALEVYSQWLAARA